MVEKKIIHKLIQKLKVGDGRNIHVNAMPNTVSKIDIYDLANIEQSLHLLFLRQLLSKKNFDFSFSLSANTLTNKNIQEKHLLRELGRKLSYLYFQNIDEYEEHGTKTFGFGFPLLIKRDQISGKIIKSPIFIWYLDLKKDTSKTDTWIISRNEDYPMLFNEVLEMQLLQQDNLRIQDILPDEEEICTESLLSDFCVQLLNKFNVKLSDNDSIVKLMPCTNNESIDVLTTDTPWIRWSGVLGQYKTQKQSIIQDLETLFSMEEKTSDTIISQYLEGIELPIMNLDSSQEGILEYLEQKNRIVIQGPPGTGKSQTLTAIITYALLNQKSILVVCEKKTAMDVLYNNLSILGLQDECLLIEDSYKDRKAVVERARKWLDSDDLNPPIFKEQDFSFLQGQYFTKKEELNFRLNMAQQNVFGDDTLLELIIKVKKLKKDFSEKLDHIQIPVEYRDYLAKSNAIAEIAKKITPIDFDKNSLSKNIFKEEKNLEIIIDRYNDIYLKINELLRFIKSNTLKFGTNFTSLKGMNNIKLSIGSLINSTIKEAKISREISLEKYAHLFPLLQSKSIVIVDFPAPESLDSLTLLVSPLQQSVDALIPLLKDTDTLSRFVSDNVFIFQYGIDDVIGQLYAIPEASRWQGIYSYNALQDKITQFFVDNAIKEDSDQLIEDFIALEEQIIELTKQKIKHQIFVNRRAKLEQSDKTKLKYLYNLRKNKQFASRNSLRNIIHADIGIFQSLFPVLMVNPVVCSSILPLQEGLYDLLIMDEASQLKLEDTYAALYRGKTHIISGDKHQMPPSGFFSVVMQHSSEEGEITDEEAILQYLADSKSLLEYAEDNNYFQHYLDFHYRSRHPHLINFSNHSFYNSRLVPLPPQKPYQSISYHFIDGIYAENMNIKEAEAVTDFVFDTYAHSNFSLGIATFNLLQRNLVWNTLWERAYESEANMKILESHLRNGLFVKNLENIQGDERDVIFLSTTFGKDENGKFRQNFGPLNTQKGYQLLNVIITRAKHYMHVITSIPLPEPNVLSESLRSSQYSGKAIVYAYLYYAKTIQDNDEVGTNWILNVMKENSSSIQNNIESNSLVKEIYNISNQIYKECNMYFGGYVLDLKSDKDAWEVGINDRQVLPSKKYRNILHKRKILKDYGIHYMPFRLYHWWKETSS